jgi:hypothetical protein
MDYGHGICPGKQQLRNPGTVLLQPHSIGSRLDDEGILVSEQATILFCERERLENPFEHSVLNGANITTRDSERDFE